MSENLWNDIYLLLESIQGDARMLLNKVGQLSNTPNARKVSSQVDEMCDALESAIEVAREA